jgi:hypothetical protein
MFSRMGPPRSTTKLAGLDPSLFGTSPATLRALAARVGAQPVVLAGRA